MKNAPYAGKNDQRSSSGELTAVVTEALRTGVRQTPAQKRGETVSARTEREEVGVAVNEQVSSPTNVNEHVSTPSDISGQVSSPANSKGSIRDVDASGNIHEREIENEVPSRENVVPDVDQDNTTRLSSTRVVDIDIAGTQDDNTHLASTRVVDVDIAGTNDLDPDLLVPGAPVDMNNNGGGERGVKTLSSRKPTIVFLPRDEQIVSTRSSMKRRNVTNNAEGQADVERDDGQERNVDGRGDDCVASLRLAD